MNDSRKDAGSSFDSPGKEYFASVAASAFGPIAFEWSVGAVTGQGGQDGKAIMRRIYLDLNKAEKSIARSGGRFVPKGKMPSELMVFVDAVFAFILDADKVFPLELLDFSGCGSFQTAVLRHEHAIPRGAVSTYSFLARACGSPKAVRAAGSSLARNPFPLLIPCHRALRSDGSLGGYQGGLAMKRRLLEREGVVFLASGKVDLARANIWRFD
jgi:O-6-methylguanine DNA methyltransferase